MSAWTSVNDFLPELDGLYIVASPTHKRAFVAHFTHNLHAVSAHLAPDRKPGWWNDDDEAVWAYRDITHWMPLPTVEELYGPRL